MPLDTEPRTRLTNAEREVLDAALSREIAYQVMRKRRALTVFSADDAAWRLHVLDSLQASIGGR